MPLITPEDASIKLLYNWIDSHADEIVESLRGVLRIPSLEAAPEPDAPFGKPVRDALDYTLALCEKLGFETKDVNGYAGHAGFGKGSELIMAMGHLDVVPEGDGWQHPPYGAELEDGYIYARGAADDKGPTYAALFGAKAIMDSGLPLSRRIRVLFGCNEESGFNCVRYYWDIALEERPTYAFTPDADFPLVFAEKGIANLILEKKITASDASLKIAAASGGRRPNMVPDSAEAMLTGTPKAVAQAAETLSRFWDKNVSVEASANGVTVRATGKSAHGSTPHLGDNAVTRLARALATLETDANADWLQWIIETTDTTGGALGIAHSDNVAGALTSNLGIFELKDDTVRLTYNVRYPVMWTIHSLLEANAPVLKHGGWTLVEHHDQPPLYVPLDKDPVKTLLRVYREATGDTTTQPQTMGGGTYARATPNAVAFGAGFPGGSDGPAHEPDERLAVETLLDAAKIYAHGLYELAK